MVIFYYIKQNRQKPEHYLQRTEEGKVQLQHDAAKEQQSQ